MAQVFAGCLLERLPSPHSTLFAPARGAPISFFEFAPRPPYPTFSTLARFRKQVKTPLDIALVAPRAMLGGERGPLRPGPELDKSVDWLTRVADILGAFAIVVASGAELTPGERDRSLLTAFVARLKVKGAQVVIAPRGLWEPEDAAPFAAKIGAIYGFDPLEHDAPPGEIVYARVRPMGARPRLTEGHLLQIAERMAGAQRGYVAVESDSAVRDMRRLAQAIEGYEPVAEDDDELDEELELDEEGESEDEAGDLEGDDTEPGADDDDANLDEDELDDDGESDEEDDGLDEDEEVEDFEDDEDEEEDEGEEEAGDDDDGEKP
jgi:hypothetical protein